MMDVNEHTRLSCEGLSDEQFNRLLKEPIFVDFLNTFLSFPIFPKRLRYNLDDDIFDIYPPVKRTAYFVLQRKIKIWVYHSRLPLFFQTDLFLDYLLCRLLSKSSTVSEVLTEMYFNSVEDMHTFRRFIRGTMGDRILNFWLDAERYRRQVEPENRRYVFREIQNKYLRGGAPFELTDVMKWMSLCGGVKGMETKSFTSPVQVTKKLCGTSISVFSPNIFVPLQKMVLRRLRSYWVAKFVLHRERIRNRAKSRWRKSIKFGDMMDDDVEGAGMLAAVQELALLHEQQTDKDGNIDVDEYMELHKAQSEESIDEQEKAEEEKKQLMERWSDWFWGSSRTASKESIVDDEYSSGGSRLSQYSTSEFRLPTPLLRPQSKGTPSSLKSSASSPLPRLCKTPARQIGSSQSRYIGSGSQSDSILSTPEAMKEINKILAEEQQEEEGEKEDKEEKARKIEPSPTQVRMELEKYSLGFPRVDPPYALSLDKDTGKKTVFEAVYTDQDTDSEDEDEHSTSSKDFFAKTTLQAMERAPLPRIIQLAVTPEEVMKVLVKPRTALPGHIIEYQRFLQGQGSQGDALLSAVSSDRFAGGPFHQYLKKTKNVEALVRLDFWNEAQQYLVPPETLGITTKYRMAMMLLGAFLMTDAPRCVPMSALARKELIRLLPIEQGDAILTHESRNVIKGLMSPWLEYIRAEDDHFISSVTKPKKVKTEKTMPVQATEPKLKRQVELDHVLDHVLEEQEKDESSDEDSELEEKISKLKKEGKKVNTWRSLFAGGGDYNDETSDEEEDETAKVVIPSLKQINRQRDLERANNAASHFYGTIKKETTSTSSSSPAAAKTRPNRPRNFQECLHDNSQFAWFKCYLMEQSSDTPLMFWQAVENMKTNCKDAKSRQARANVIVRKYFINIDIPATENLQCKADIIKDIPVIEKVTPPMLLSAQACVARTLEEEWFRKYVATFPEEDEGVNLQKYAMRNTLAGVYKMAAHGKTRGLWAMFASNVMNFQKGIYDAKTVQEFITFLHKEKDATIEHNTRRHALNPTRRMINNKFINTEKLTNDLAFWKEVVKFKEVADNANECARRGNYSTDDEMQVLSKAKTIIKVFLDSDLPPRTQINVPNDLGDSIINLVNAGIVERGIFHDAQLSVFITLIHYWKKFAAERKNKKDETPKDTPMPKKDDLKKKRISFIGGVPYRRVYVMQEEETRWSFSFYQGLRLAIPVKLLARRVTRGDVLPQELSGTPPAGQ